MEMGEKREKMIKKLQSYKVTNNGQETRRGRAVIQNKSQDEGMLRKIMYMQRSFIASFLCFKRSTVFGQESSVSPERNMLIRLFPKRLL
jgi:hypothetical protein